MKNLYDAYWTEFMTALRRRPSFPLGPKKVPQNRNWLEWSCFDRKGFKLFATVSQNYEWICINFGINTSDQKHYFTSLYENRYEINGDVGLTLRWVREPPEKSNTQAIITKYGVDVQDPKDWQNQHVWMLDTLEKLYKGFHCHIQALPDD